MVWTSHYAGGTIWSLSTAVSLIKGNWSFLCLLSTPCGIFYNIQSPLSHRELEHSSRGLRQAAQYLYRPGTNLPKTVQSQEIHDDISGILAKNLPQSERQEHSNLLWSQTLFPFNPIARFSPSNHNPVLLRDKESSVYWKFVLQI